MRHVRALRKPSLGGDHPARSGRNVPHAAARRLRLPERAAGDGDHLFGRRVVRLPAGAVRLHGSEPVPVGIRVGVRTAWNGLSAASTRRRVGVLGDGTHLPIRRVRLFRRARGVYVHGRGVGRVAGNVRGLNRPCPASVRRSRSGVPSPVPHPDYAKRLFVSAQDRLFYLASHLGELGAKLLARSWLSSRSAPRPSFPGPRAKGPRPHRCARGPLALPTRCRD